MNTHLRIVLISDGNYCLDLLKGYCHILNHSLFEVDENTESINKMIEMQPNLIILALHMPQNRSKKTDLKLIRELSIRNKIPVCCLRDDYSAELAPEVVEWVDRFLDDPLDIIQLDDYLRKKFRHHDRRHNERRTKGDRRAISRNSQHNNPAKERLDDGKLSINHKEDCFSVGPFQIDQRSKCVLFDGKTIDLTRKEFDLLHLLATDVDRVFLADEIIDYLWPVNDRATKADLYQYMHLLRKKIEKDPNNPQWILTVKGFGYRLNVSMPDDVKGKERPVLGQRDKKSIPFELPSNKYIN